MNKDLKDYFNILCHNVYLLIVTNNNEFRIDEINNARVKKLINNYEKFEDSKYYGM